MAEMAAASPSSLPQSWTGRFEVKSVLTRSCLRMTNSRRSSPAEVGSLRIPRSSMISNGAAESRA